MKPEPVEIWCPVEKDAAGYPRQDREQLYAWPTSDGYELDNVPFFVKGLAVGDVVAASMADGGRLAFDRVVKRSGHSTFRIWLTEPTAIRVLDDLRRLGCAAEVTLERLIAIDVPPDREAQAWEFLEAGRARGAWDVQVGHSPDDGLARSAGK